MQPKNVVSIKRVAVGTLLPAPLGALVMVIFTVVADSRALDFDALIMVPLFALFGFSLIGLQSLIAALVLEFWAIRPDRSLHTIWLAGAGLGVLSTVPLWKSNSDYLTLAMLGLFVGVATALAMRKVGLMLIAKQQSVGVAV